MITRWTVADGSYGFRAKTPGGVLTVWCCGQKPTTSDPRITWTPLVCVHRTRAEARACPGKEVAWDGQFQVLVPKAAPVNH